MKITEDRRISNILEQVKNTEEGVLYDENRRSIINFHRNDYDMFCNAYYEWFIRRHDYIRLLYHKFEQIWEKPFSRTFLEETPPALYHSGNGEEPSFYNAIRDIKNNLDLIEELDVADKKSIDVIYSIIKYRLTGNKLNLFYENDIPKHMYFDKSICDLFSHRLNVAVDIGAYNGDSLKKINKRRVSKSYSFEANPINYERLNRVKKKNNICRNVAIGDKPGYIALIGEGDSCRVEPGNNGRRIKMSTIDAEINERIDFIKMDIEGSEFLALKGARQHIVNDMPVMAISIYHKLEDFYLIPNYIKSLNQKYSFKFRHYGESITEYVLYAY